MSAATLAALALQFLPGVGVTRAEAHEESCKNKTGIELARCERHQLMFAKCGPIKGDAHFACDREFILAAPLNCSALTGDDAKACQTELAAVKTCQPQEGRAFMRCVRDAVAPPAAASAAKP